MKKSARILLCIFLSLPACISLGATLTVNTNLDAGPGSLRSTIAQTQPGDTVVFGLPLGSTIVLTNGELGITNPISIVGPGAAYLAIDGNASSRIFNIAPGVQVSISGVTLQHGAAMSGGAIFNAGNLALTDSELTGNTAYSHGGALAAAPGSTWSISGCTFDHNTAAIGGGAFSAGVFVPSSPALINMLARTTTYRSVSLNNSGNNFIVVPAGARMTLTADYSTSYNDCPTCCPGCITQDYLNINGTQLNCVSFVQTSSGDINLCFNAPGTPGVYYITQTGSWDYYCNQPGFPPSPFYNDPAAAIAVVVVGDPAAAISTGTVFDSTISGNQASQQGGGIELGLLANLSVQSTTVASNNATTGSGAFVTTQAPATGLSIGDTIVVGNTPQQGPDIVGSFTSLGYNLVGNANGTAGFASTDLLNVDPLLGPLTNNGGETPTHALGQSSPAIDAGNPSFVPPPMLDQRGPGFLRVVGGRVDIGAFELGCLLPIINCPPNIVANTAPGQCTATVNFSVTASDRCGNATVISIPPSGSQFSLGHTTVNSAALGDWLPGLAHYFDADNNAVDRVTGQTAQLGAGVTFAPGVTGSAFNFAGSADGFITTGLPTLYGPWSASFWVNRQDTPTVSAVLTADDNYALKLEQYLTPRFVGITHFGYVDWSFSPSYIAPVGTWVHLVFVATGSDTKLYVNGQYAATITGVSLPLPLKYLSRPGLNDWLKGLVDDVAVFDRVLTDQEINDIFTYKTVNTLAKCSFDVLVQDSVAPAFANFPSAITVYTGPGSTACSLPVTWTPPTASTPCQTVSSSSDHNPGDLFPIGTTVVTYKASEPFGQTTTQSFTVTVVDNTPPTLVVPGSITVPADQGKCSASNVQLGSATATDNCGTPNVSNDAPTVFPVGTTTVTWTAVDGSGNKTTGLQTVTVVDTQPPTITVPATIVVDPPAGQCTAIVSYSPTAWDNCSGTVPVTSTPPSGSTFSYGTNVVTCVATDAAGNTGTSNFFVVVRDPLNISWPNALRLSPASSGPSTLQASQFQPLTQLGEARWYKLTVIPGSQLVVTLTGLKENFDLFLFKDIAAAYNALLTPQDLVQLSAEFAPSAFSPSAFSSEIFSPSAFSPSAFSPSAFSPSAFSPSAFSPSAFSPSAFSPSAFSPSAFSPSAFSPSAFSPSAFSPSAFSPSAFSPSAFSPSAFSPSAFSPSAFSSAQSRTLIGISAFPGTAGQGIVVNTYADVGDYYVCVRGANGAYNQPGEFYQLSVSEFTGLCGNVTPVLLPPSTSAAAMGYHTLILTDFSRLSGTPADVSALKTAIASFVARPEVQGILVDVGQDTSVQAANIQADANPGCTFAKNYVANIIHQIVEEYHAHNPVEYVVLIGGDNVIPFMRYPDDAGLANEDGFDVPVGGLTPSQASIKSGQVLSQDDYGSLCSISLKDTRLVLPDAAVGRLVESASEATGLINAYLSPAGGVVPTPSTALVTGYDFLQDCATAVAGQLSASLGAPNVTTLISPNTSAPANSWTADQLRPLLLNSRHDIIFLAGHFNSGSLLAADFATSIFSPELANPSLNLVNALIYSAGCHSGYNVVDGDAIPYVTIEPDWSQMFARKGATFIGGTGYQYGDTDFIEYDERLYLNFTQILREGAGPVAIGKALVKAKQRYLANTPVLRGIHEKALREVALFGLPMLSMNLPNRVSVPSGSSIVSALNSYTTNPGQALGLQSADITVPITGLGLSNSTLTIYPVPTTGPTTLAASYLDGPDGHVSNPAEPILPLEIRDVTVAGTVLRGTGFRAGTYQDTDGVRPLTGAPATENRGVHAPFLTPVFYPLKPWSVNYFDALCGLGSGSTRLNLMPSQYQSDSATSDTGVRRVFSNMSFRLFYSAYTTSTTSGGVTVSPAAAAPPSVVNVSDSFAASSSTLSFQVQVTGDPNAGIQAVWVTYTSSNSPWTGQWQSLDLTQNVANSTLWQGSLTLPTGVTSSSVSYMVQAVNGVGLVTLDNNLGAFYTPAATSPSPQITPPPPQQTSVNFVSPHAMGRFGASAQFQLALTASGVPLQNAIIDVTIGSQFLQSTPTDANGNTTVTLPLLATPGQYSVSATYVAQPGYQGSYTSTPFTITQLGTTLTLSPILPNVPLSNIVATLTDANGNTLPGKTVFFVLSGGATPFGMAVATDFAGRARFVGTGVPPGYYTVSAYFSGNVPAPISQTLNDPQYLPSSASLITDTQQPTIIAPPAVTVNSPADVPPHDFAGGTATDNRPGVIVAWVSDVPSTPPTCGGTIIRTYMATDAAGNTASATQLITILPQLIFSDEHVQVHYDCVSSPGSAANGAYSKTEIEGMIQFCDPSRTSDSILSTLSASQVTAFVTATINGNPIASGSIPLKVRGSKRDDWESGSSSSGQVDTLNIEWNGAPHFDTTASNPLSPAIQSKFIGSSSTDLRFTAKRGNYTTTLPNGISITVANGLIATTTGLPSSAYEIRGDKTGVDLTVPFAIVPGMTFVTSGTVNDTSVLTAGVNYFSETARFELKLRSSGLATLPLFNTQGASLKYEITLGTGTGEHPAFGRSIIGVSTKPWDSQTGNHRCYRSNSVD
ncbi:MAG TPA: HYR domain-containing protein [Verrucomicrobiae bacterium]|nr:HYR domain-containing protein [Verrucomicrobiae bacterium]